MDAVQNAETSVYWCRAICALSLKQSEKLKIKKIVVLVLSLLEILISYIMCTDTFIFLLD